MLVIVSIDSNCVGIMYVAIIVRAIRKIKAEKDVYLVSCSC